MLYIFDKDGTLIGRAGDRPPNTIAEQRLLPGVAEKCERLRAEGHILAIASNQGGVAWDFISEIQAGKLMAQAATLIGAKAWRMCPHHPQGRIRGYAIACPCRKPQPGMLVSLMAQFNSAPADTIYIGDQESDISAAEAADIRFIWADKFFGRDPNGE